MMMISPQILLLLFGLYPHSSYQLVNIEQAKKYIEGFLTDLELITDPSKIISPQSDPAALHAIREEVIQALLHETTRNESLEYSDSFQKMVELYSNIQLNRVPALSLSKVLQHGDPCNPLHHFNIAPNVLLDISSDPTSFFPALGEWLKKTSAADFSICDTHLGLICDSTQTPHKCTCQPETKWIQPPGKCLLSPGSTCTFRNIFLQSAHYRNVGDPQWYATRVFLYPVAHPTCGEGLACDAITDRVNLTKVCWCLEKSSRNGECMDKPTWTESESIDHKLSKITHQFSDPCVPPPGDIKDIIKTLRTTKLNSSMSEDLKTSLVQKNFPVCDFENHELCSEDDKICLRVCASPDQVHDAFFECKVNYGLACSKRGDCITNSECTRVATSKSQSVLTCTCTATEESKGLYIRELWYGNKCSLKPKSFWLGLFKPFKSGISGDVFIKEEVEIDKQLKEIETQSISGLGATCNFSLEFPVLQALQYFGSTDKPLKHEYKPLLDEALKSVKNNTQKLCHHNHFLGCNQSTNTCELISQRFIFNEDTHSLHFASGQICNEFIPPDIPKVFYLVDEKSKLTCVPNSFCVVDLSKPREVVNGSSSRPPRIYRRTCRCARRFTGPSCNITLDKPVPYTDLEKANLTSLIQLVLSVSVLGFGEMCSLKVEGDLASKNISLSEDTDLYELISALDPMLDESKEDFQFYPGLSLCNQRELLTCSKVSADPFNPKDSTNAAMCDCMSGYERLWSRRDDNKCYISDGRPCGPSWRYGHSYLASLLQNDSSSVTCASGQCSPSVPGEPFHICDEDTSYRYIVPKNLSNSSSIPPVPFLIYLIIVSCLSSALFCAYSTSLLVHK